VIDVTHICLCVDLAELNCSTSSWVDVLAWDLIGIIWDFVLYEFLLIIGLEFWSFENCCSGPMVREVVVAVFVIVCWYVCWYGPLAGDVCLMVVLFRGRNSGRRGIL